MTDKSDGGRFITGNNGGPGRPKGSRNRLSEAFLSAVCDDFAEHGVEAIRRVREEEPATYVRVVASILPKHVRLDEGSDLDSLSDEQIEARIRTLDGQIAVARIDRREN